MQSGVLEWREDSILRKSFSCICNAALCMFKDVNIALSPSLKYLHFEFNRTTLLKYTAANDDSIAKERGNQDHIQKYALLFWGEQMPLFTP